MSRLRVFLKNIGEGFLAMSDSKILNAIFGAGITTLISYSSSVRKVLSRMVTLIDLSTAIGTILGWILFVIVIATFTAFFGAVFKEIGSGLVWLSEHKLDSPVAKISLSVERNPKDENEYILKVNNKNGNDAHEVFISYQIATKDNLKCYYENALWTDAKNEKDSYKRKFVKIPSKDGKDAFFIRFDKDIRKFVMKTMYNNVFIDFGEYDLTVSLQGKMVAKKVVGELSGRIMLLEDGQVIQHIKQVKQRRGWVSLVPRMPFG